MKNLKLIALTAATTITLLGTPLTSMAAGSCNTVTVRKSCGITAFTNNSNRCGTAGNSFRCNKNTRSCTHYSVGNRQCSRPCVRNYFFSPQS